MIHMSVCILFNIRLEVPDIFGIIPLNHFIEQKFYPFEYCFVLTVILIKIMQDVMSSSIQWNKVFLIQIRIFARIKSHMMKLEIFWHLLQCYRINFILKSRTKFFPESRPSEFRFFQRCQTFTFDRLYE